MKKNNPHETFSAGPKFYDLRMESAITQEREEPRIDSDSLFRLIRKNLVQIKNKYDITKAEVLGLEVNDAKNELTFNFQIMDAKTGAMQKQKIAIVGRPRDLVHLYNELSRMVAEVFEIPPPKPEYSV